MSKAPSNVGSARKHDLDSFLGHDTRGGDNASFLENWKNRTPPVVKVLLHTSGQPISVYQHPWPKVVTRERDGTEVTEVWGGNWNSWESEEILQRQYLRHDDGTRKHAPEVCPMAIMLEEVERLMREGDLAWDTALFKFDADDKEHTKVLHAGAITNKAKKIWEDKKTTPDMKRKARKKGFPGPADAWMCNMMAKCQYVLTVVDYDDVEAGIQITKETTLVGDKLKKAIRDRRTSEGDDEGNPLVNPYVIQFTHKPKAKKFDERYDVVIVAKLKVTDEMRELIVDKDPPDLERYTAPGDIEELRASMEDHYIGPADLLDWDFIFGKAEALIAEDGGEPAKEEETDQGDDSEEADSTEDGEEADGTEAPEEETEAGDGDGEEEGEGEEEPDRIIAKRKGKGENQQCFAADGAELFGCEQCDAIMRDDETVCHNCGEDYGEDDETPDPDPEPELELTPPPTRRKAAAKKPVGTTKKKAASKKKTGSASGRAAKAGKDGVGF